LNGICNAGASQVLIVLIAHLGALAGRRAEAGVAAARLD
jgi:hypothetical protein